MDALAEPEQDDRRDYEPELKAASDKFDRWLPPVVEAVIRALFTTGEPDKNDPLIVAHTLERVQADERLMRFVARFVEERNVEEEIEHRVTALTADLERESEELAAQRAEFARV
jgi:hypothetical protein